MIGEPESTPPLTRVVMPGNKQHGYRVYPLVDHIADKVVATFQLYGEQQRPSTRYKDLVDLVSITTGASVAAERQHNALGSEAERRGVALPPASTSPTGHCGSLATQPRQDDLCCLSDGRSPRRSRSLEPSSIPCST